MARTISTHVVVDSDPDDVRWEYHTKRFGSLLDEHALNSYGETGWELVAIVDGVCYFKRPRRD